MFKGGKIEYNDYVRDFQDSAPIQGPYIKVINSCRAGELPHVEDLLTITNPPWLVIAPSG